MKYLLFSVTLLGVALAGSRLLPNKAAETGSVSKVEIPSTSPQNPEELGAVHWLRDLDEGQAAARKTGKPLLILFQEVPGCSNCTRYGNSTLSHPLIVEAIESYFVPVCIYNNKGAKDGEALKKFGEPAWNNPVVRLVGADLTDMYPRIADFGSSAQLVHGMRQTLEKTGQSVPKYLQLLEEELAARESGLETAVFSMYCFWSGEGAFGEIDGVIETEPGFQDGKEAVRVQFDPSMVSKKQLEAMTQPKGIESCNKQDGFRSDREPKYYLSHTDYKYLPMSSIQACRINSLLGKKQSPEAYLSPRQLEWLKKIGSGAVKNPKIMIGRRDLARAWEELSAG